jgi:2-amino-4-hydroxy-6-hydroxymethyldihydropteridine diphosphokinase
MVRAAIGLGSNLGDRLGFLRSGIHGLDRVGTMVAVSSLYETVPVGGPEQDSFLNAVALIETPLSPVDLLAALLAIEASAGRVRVERWGPRTLDLDLIVYDQAAVDTPELELPHPRAHERRFVLDPLVEVWPEAILRSGTARQAADSPEITGQEVALLASQWIEGVPRFQNRGGAWVAAQAALLAVWAVVFVATAGFPPMEWLWVGAVPAVVGVWLALAAVPSLGAGLTPFPAPSASGQLATNGPYRFVRHPMYGGILLVVLGSSVLGASIAALGAGIVLGMLFFFKARHEERLLRVAYPDYPAYAGMVTKRLIPGVI